MGGAGHRGTGGTLRLDVCAGSNSAFAGSGADAACFRRRSLPVGMQPVHRWNGHPRGRAGACGRGRLPCIRTAPRPRLQPAAPDYSAAAHARPPANHLHVIVARTACHSQNDERPTRDLDTDRPPLARGTLHSREIPCNFTTEKLPAFALQLLIVTLTVGATGTPTPLLYRPGFPTRRLEQCRPALPQLRRVDHGQHPPQLRTGEAQALPQIRGDNVTCDL